jgi:hypothetical protein
MARLPTPDSGLPTPDSPRLPVQYFLCSIRAAIYSIRCSLLT